MNCDFYGFALLKKKALSETLYCSTATTTSRIDTFEIFKIMCKSWSFYSCTFLVRRSGIQMRTRHIVNTMKLSKFSSTSFKSRLESFGGHLRVLWSRKSKNMTKWNFCSIVYAMKTFNLQIQKVQSFIIFCYLFTLHL